MVVKTRIAPSPTGNLHLGTVRTALYNILFAKSRGGLFFFRLEDTDLERSKEEFTKEIIEGFKWLHIGWDRPSGLLIGLTEGGFVRQSARDAVHKTYIQKLLAEKKAYKCFASTEELDALRRQQRSMKQPEGYDNRGRSLTESQVQAYEAEGRNYAVRLNLGAARDIQWQDLVRGQMSINTKDLGGDPVIQKSSGQTLYNFAVVVDDYEMGITHVFRGEDHLTNTAKQIAIFEAFGFPVPEFGHLPLIFTVDREKLSKRKHGDIAGVEKYSREGYLPEALINYLISTSYSSGADSELYTMDSAIHNFDVTHISKSPAVYDLKKLNWFNRAYIARLDYHGFCEHLKPYLRYDLNNLASDDKMALLEAVRGNLDKFSDINDNISYFFEDFTVEEGLQQYINSGLPVLRALRDAISNNQVDAGNALAIKDYISGIGKQLGVKGKDLFYPIRIALSGRNHGPELGLIVYLLGREKSLERLGKFCD
jgi:glutamyl-tRNA synthetase